MSEELSPIEPERVGEPEAPRPRSALVFGLISLAITALALLAGASFSGVLGLVAAVVDSGQLVDPAQIAEAALRVAGPGTTLGLVLALIPSSLSFAFFAVIFSTRRNDPIPRAARLRLRSAAPADFVLVAAGMVGLSVALGSVLSLLGWSDEGTLRMFSDVLKKLSFGERLLLLPVSAVLPGIAEELFFRGLVLSQGERTSSRAAGVAVSALLFGLVHLDPAQSTAALAMGLFLAFAVLRTGSLYTVMFAHFVNNALATLAPEFGSEKSDALILLPIGAVVAVVVTLVLLRRPERS